MKPMPFIVGYAAYPPPPSIGPPAIAPRGREKPGGAYPVGAPSMDVAGIADGIDPTIVRYGSIAAPAVANPPIPEDMPG